MFATTSILPLAQPNKARFFRIQACALFEPAQAGEFARAGKAVRREGSRAPGAACNRGRLSLLTFFGDTKKVSRRAATERKGKAGRKGCHPENLVVKKNPKKAA